MAQAATKRFFSPIVALVALVILALGVVVTTAGVNALMNAERGGAKVCLFGGVLVLFGIAAFFVGAFKKGCTNCKKRFTTAYAEFPPNEYERVVGIVASDDPGAIRSLVHDPAARANHRACLEVQHCPKCRKVGQLRVIDMNYNGQYDHFNRGTKERPVSTEVIEAALSVIDGREQPPKR